MASAEEWAHSAAQAAQRSATSAKETANAAMRMEQASALTQREIHQMRGEMVVGFQSVRDRLTQVEAKVGSYRQNQHVVTHEDFQETPTGSYKITKETFSTLLDEHKLHEDGRKWRRAWRKVRGLVWTVAGAAAGIGIERFIVWLLSHA